MSRTPIKIQCQKCGGFGESLRAEMRGDVIEFRWLCFDCSCTESEREAWKKAQRQS